LDHYSGVDTAPAVATNAHTGACDGYIVRVPHVVLIELTRIALGSLREAVLYRRCGRFAREPNPAARRFLRRCIGEAQTNARSPNCHTSDVEAFAMRWLLLGMLRFLLRELAQAALGRLFTAVLDL